MSSSTASTDRREKLVAYQQLPTLLTYVLVAQSKKFVEIYRKERDNWTVERLGANETFEVLIEGDKSIELSVSEIYEDIDLDESPELQIHDNVEVYTY